MIRATGYLYRNVDYNLTSLPFQTKFTFEQANAYLYFSYGYYLFSCFHKKFVFFPESFFTTSLSF
ncbi:hypothetical protein BOO28_17065 [Vibrio navarrensis]|nr:hypothetical protein [Vibrio navarrensis]